GARVPGMGKSVDEIRARELRPRSITAFLVGLESRLGVFAFQRSANEYRREPLLAILPGVALQELWDLMGTAEAALSVVSVFVVAAGLLGMLTMLLSSLNERRREMAILRSIGCRPVHVFGLFVAEAATLTSAGAVTGLALLYGVLLAAQPLIDAHFGLFLEIGAPAAREIAIVALVFAAGTLAGTLPAYRAYHRSLADGMIVRT
ncbi:MAG: ABC transporter permease, partial [Kiritimatiellia bacterium]|nr:ABC transporter permease [Kiritimatiellia bacterium]